MFVSNYENMFLNVIQVLMGHTDGYLAFVVDVFVSFFSISFFLVIILTLLSRIFCPKQLAVRDAIKPPCN